MGPVPNAWHLPTSTCMYFKLHRGSNSNSFRRIREKKNWICQKMSVGEDIFLNLWKGILLCFNFSMKIPKRYFLFENIKKVSFKINRRNNFFGLNATLPNLPLFSDIVHSLEVEIWGPVCPLILLDYPTTQRIFLTWLPKTLVR